MKPGIAIFLTILWPPLSTAAQWSNGLHSFIEESCVNCDDASTEIRLDFTSLGYDLENDEVLLKWVDVFDRVERGEMPPASEAAPIEESRLTAMALLKAELKRVNRRSQQTIGRVPSRRLSRHEYEHTLHDFVASVRIPLRAILVSPQLLFQTGEAARIRSAVPRSEYGERVVASSCHDKDPPRRRAQR